MVDDTDLTPRLLVLGGPSSGKSTYRAQVYQRIANQPGELSLVKSVSDLTAIEGDVSLLLQGLQLRHTNASTYHSTALTIENRSGRRFALEFADYGGEQVGRMASSNHLTSQWVERSQTADRWLFFLRVDNVRSVKSFMTDPVASGPRTETSTPPPAETPSEVSAIETLQRLLFVRGASAQLPLRSPRLAVLLSCWDELPKTERDLSPSELLDARAPLLSRYLGATWRPEHLKVWGLSSTEQSLPEKIGDANFARKGPEHFGYVVGGKGKTDRDLTIPLSWLLQPNE
jgi:hypothetical protein